MKTLISIGAEFSLISINVSVYAALAVSSGARESILQILPVQERFPF